MIDSERIDLRDPVAVICERLGLEREFVGELVVTPRTITATVYRKNENGHKFIDPVLNEPAQRTETFEIRA